MNKHIIATFVAVVSFVIGCGGYEESSVADKGDDQQSPLPTDFAYNCDEVEFYVHLLDGLPKNGNSSDSDILALREEFASAIARCEEIVVSDQHNDVPSDWKSFEFDGRTYYYTPLADVPLN
jgi:ubiquitin C-terminal hydrolase